MPRNKTEAAIILWLRRRNKTGESTIADQIEAGAYLEPDPYAEEWRKYQSGDWTASDFMLAVVERFGLTLADAEQQFNLRSDEPARFNPAQYAPKQH